MQRQTFPPATVANSGARRTGGGFVADGLAEIYPTTPSCADRLHGSVANRWTVRLRSKLVKSLASLLVVTSGSAIGREGAMILLAALAASCFAQRFTPRRVEIMDRLWGRGGNGCGLSCPACWQFIYRRSAVWHYDVGLSRPGDYFAVVALLVSNLINHSDALLYNVQLSVTVQARDYALIISTGVLAGLCGPLLLTLMNACHRGFVSLKLAPPRQLALGGLIVGLLSLFTPAVWGNGYSTVQSF